MFLYVITNRVNGKQYVGITTDVEKRWRKHRSGHGSKLVRHAIQKYGRDNFDFEVWYSGDEDWIKMMEYRAIVMLDTRTPHGYNLTLGGEGSLGCKPGTGTRQKMSVAHRGRRHSLDTRQRLSAVRKGRTPWNCGRHHLPETRRKISAALSRKSKKRSEHPGARSIVVDGVVYGCIKDAASAMGIHANALRTRLWRYAHSGCRPVGWSFETRFDTSLNRKDQINGQD